MREGLIAKVNYIGMGAVYEWGRQAQMVKTCEEAGELVTVLCKSINGSPVTEAQIIDEIADVLFMVLQMRMIFGEQAVDERLDYKLERTRTALQGFRTERALDPQKGTTAERQNQGERNET